MIRVGEIKNALLHLCFPHVCIGCGSDSLSVENDLCLVCTSTLPFTGFAGRADNPIERMFWGRISLETAMACLFFQDQSVVQRLMHELKYRGNRELGLQLGEIMGTAIRDSNRIFPDAIVPLPLFKSRERKRGYNQSMLLCQGVARQLHLPLIGDAVVRREFTDTQTRRGRTARWENMEGKFAVANAPAIEGKHLLLVDDVITTGATMEACGAVMLRVPGVRLSVAGLCVAQR